MSSDDALPPLTAADLLKARAELAECMDPREFQRRVRGLEPRVTAERKFNDNEYKFLREAWVLAELSKRKPFVQIRLAGVAERWPDGYAQTENGEVLKIEITSAQTPGRELGTEYRPDRRPKEYDAIENVEDFAAVLEDAIKKKVKDENRGCALVVDLNIVKAIITPEEKEKVIVCTKDKYASVFKHLWILWQDKVF
jgi:hypothetical protein